jgi:hypothetical protein
MKDSVTVPFETKGDITGTDWKGVFKAKVKLSNREFLREDEVFRTVLGKSPDSAGGPAKALASQVAYLTVRLTEAPPWFYAANNGLDFEDENLLDEIAVAVQKAVNAERATHIKEAEAAQPALAKAAEKLEAEGK